MITFKVEGAFTTREGGKFTLSGEVEAGAPEDAISAMLASLKRNGYDINHQSLEAKPPQPIVWGYSITAVS